MNQKIKIYHHTHLPYKIIVLIIVLILFLHFFFGDLVIFRPLIFFDQDASTQSFLSAQKNQDEWAQLNQSSVFFQNPLNNVSDEASAFNKEDLSDSSESIQVQKPTDLTMTEEKKESPLINQIHEEDIPSEVPIEAKNKENTQEEQHAQTYMPSILKRKKIVLDKNKKQSQRYTNKQKTNSPARMTLKQLAQCFLQHMRNKENTKINVAGNTHAHATQFQLVYTRYMEKIMSCIINSCLCNKTKMPFVKSTQHEGIIAFALNKNGSINQLFIKQESGNTQADQFVLYILKEAESSFPKIPDDLDMERLPITIRYTNIKAFESMQGWTLK